MTRIFLTLALAITASALLAACATGGPDDELKAEVVANYADGVHHLYSRSLASAQSMRDAIYTFADDPTPGASRSRQAACGLSRGTITVPPKRSGFTTGQSTTPDDGPEGLINAWPMDESYVDYVEGSPSAGIINNPAAFPVLDADLDCVAQRRGRRGELLHRLATPSSFCCGDKTLARPVPARARWRTTRPTPTPSGARHISKWRPIRWSGIFRDMADAWAPGGGNYRARFVAMSSTTPSATSSPASAS